MKSVFKTVAPIAMTITFALSGVAMADTANTVAKSADSAKTTTETAKPVVHHHKHKAKLEAAKNTVTPTNTEKSVAAKPAATEKVAPTANSSKKVEPTKA